MHHNKNNLKKKCMKKCDMERTHRVVASIDEKSTFRALKKSGMLVLFFSVL